MINKKIVLISDFDGTITKKDFFYMAIDKFLSKNALQPWDDYLNKRITHIEALTGIFSQIHISQDEMDKFISTIDVDKYFYDTLNICKNYEIPIYLCSAGTKYYIEKRIGETLKEYNIFLLSNDGTYSQKDGLRLIAPEKTNPFYHQDTGISKELLVKSLKSQGYFTIYAGDGIPDFSSAQIADVVFAKDVLLEMCKKKGIKTEKFDSFKDISDYIRRIYDK
ncbi:MAG: MtnX-like HAD-IB family phosphatase [Endomicrobiaceae bacterium]|nr:MtnX-like HAD-IB family phosphatase [Endomicrobiaceae bacterium]